MPEKMRESRGGMQVMGITGRPVEAGLHFFIAVGLKPVKEGRQDEWNL
jgi:hypothetical protein